MGIRNLTSIINKNYGECLTRHISYLKGKKLAIDANLYLYKYLYGNGNHLQNIFLMINKFNKFKIDLLFVFDGKPPKEKEHTIEVRREIREKREIKINEIKKMLFSTTTVIDSSINKVELKEELVKLEAQNVKLTKEIINSTKDLLNLMGVPYIEGESEAELVAVQLCNKKIVDGVLSDDSDTYAAGCNMVISNFSLTSDYINIVYLSRLIDILGIKNQKKLLDLCILLGNDYIDRPSNLTVNKCIDLMKKYNNLEDIISKETVYNNNNCLDIRNLYNVSNININTDNLDIQFKKEPKINELKEFLKSNTQLSNSFIDKRLDKIYNLKKNIEFEIDEEY
jgi:flap endonuclease-1